MTNKILTIILKILAKIYFWMSMYNLKILEKYSKRLSIKKIHLLLRTTPEVTLLFFKDDVELAALANEDKFILFYEKGMTKEQFIAKNKDTSKLVDYKLEQNMQKLLQKENKNDK